MCIRVVHVQMEFHQVTFVSVCPIVLLARLALVFLSRSMFPTIVEVVRWI